MFLFTKVFCKCSPPFLWQRAVCSLLLDSQHSFPYPPLCYAFRVTGTGISGMTSLKLLCLQDSGCQFFLPEYSCEISVGGRKKWCYFFLRQHLAKWVDPRRLEALPQPVGDPSAAISQYLALISKGGALHSSDLGEGSDLPSNCLELLNVSGNFP